MSLLKLGVEALDSPCKVYSLLGITGTAKREATKSTMEAEEWASRWFWIRRSDPLANVPGSSQGLINLG